MHISVRRFDECSACRAVAGLGDRALATPRAGGVLARDETEVTHQFARRFEALEVTELGNDAHRVNRLHAAQCLQRLDYRPPAPMLEFGADRPRQALEALTGLVHRLHVLLEGDLLRRTRKLELRNPAPVFDQLLVHDRNLASGSAEADEAEL